MKSISNKFKNAKTRIRGADEEIDRTLEYIKNNYPKTYKTITIVGVALGLTTGHLLIKYNVIENLANSIEPYIH